MQITKEDMLESKVMGGDILEPSQTSSFEHKTLDETELHDIENLKHIIAKSHTYSFLSPAAAQKAFGEAVRLALLRLGIEINGTDPEPVIDATMKAKGVRVESRTEYTGPDSYRNGIYIYRENEIAYFISQIRRNGCELFFFTNVDVMASPKFYTFRAGDRVTQPAMPNTLQYLLRARQAGN